MGQGRNERIRMRPIFWHAEEYLSCARVRFAWLPGKGYNAKLAKQAPIAFSL